MRISDWSSDVSSDLAQPPRCEDEQIDRVGQQRQSQDDLEGSRAEQQPQPRRREDADGEREHDLHQSAPSPTSCDGFAARGDRIDWCAKATRMSAVVPTTTANTPISNSNTLANGIAPMIGRSR